MEQLIKVGKILGPKGLKGQVLVRAYSQLESILVPGSFFLKGPSRYEEFFISSCRKKGKKEAICTLKWVDSRLKAERIAKKEIFQMVSRLPEGDDEFYWFQLKGLKVTTSQGQYLGRVYSIIETGAGDVLVVRNEEREILVPMVEDVVTRIDIAKGECEVELPPGLQEATCSPLPSGDSSKK